MKFASWSRRCAQRRAHAALSYTRELIRKHIGVSRSGQGSFQSVEKFHSVRRTLRRRPCDADDDRSSINRIARPVENTRRRACKHGRRVRSHPIVVRFADYLSDEMSTTAPELTVRRPVYQQDELNHLCKYVKPKRIRKYRDLSITGFTFHRAPRPFTSPAWLAGLLGAFHTCTRGNSHETLTTILCAASGTGRNW